MGKWGNGKAQCEEHKCFVIPAQAGLWRHDAGTNIRIANGPKGMPQERHVIQFLLLMRWRKWKGLNYMPRLPQTFCEICYANLCSRVPLSQSSLRWNAEQKTFSL